MRLSTRSEYACLALIDLAKHYDEGLVKIDEIAKRKAIPKKYLEQILLTLKRTGYLQSKRGAQGGYRLAKAPDKISIAEIVRLMDRPLAPVESVSKHFFAHTPTEKDKALSRLFKEIRDLVAEKMESTTFESLSRRRRQAK